MLEVSRVYMSSLNQSLEVTLNTVANSSSFMEMLVIFFADYYQYVLLFIVTLFFFVGKKSKREEKGKLLLIAFVAGDLARFVIKPLLVMWYSEPRPFVSLIEVSPLIGVAESEYFQSFPSGHALFLFAASTALLYKHRHLGTFCLVSSLLIVIARVMAGVHYPLDIIAGACIGAIVGYFFAYVLEAKSKL